MNPKTPVPAPPAPLTPTLHGLSLPEVVSDFLATKPSLHTRQAYETTLRGFFEANGFHVLDDLRIMRSDKWWGCGVEKVQISKRVTDQDN